METFNVDKPKTLSGRQRTYAIKFHRAEKRPYYTLTGLGSFGFAEYEAKIIITFCVCVVKVLSIETRSETKASGLLRKQ